LCSIRRIKVKGLSDLIRQTQKIKEKMEEIQQELSSRTVEASSGGGMVKVVMNGRQQLLSLSIEPEIFQTGDKELLEDLIIAAVNEALKKSQELWIEELKKITGGFPIPGLF
jgi:DNA-binding YbaB/EbfC family protein